jgi:transposase
MNEEFPQIRSDARRVGATVFFGDEAGVKSTSHGGTTWAPRGETPIIRTTGARFGINILSAVSNRGDFRFMLHEGSVTTIVFIEFLKRMIYNSEKPIYLIVDGHPTHKSKAVKTYLEGVTDKLKVFFLPGYSPELNPDEFVWNDLKSNCIGRMTVDGPEHLKKSILSHLRSMQQKRSLIRSFFLAPDTCYAAAA